MSLGDVRRGVVDYLGVRNRESGAVILKVGMVLPKITLKHVGVVREGGEADA